MALPVHRRASVHPANTSPNNAEYSRHRALHLLPEIPPATLRRSPQENAYASTAASGQSRGQVFVLTRGWNQSTPESRKEPPPDRALSLTPLSLLSPFPGRPRWLPYP